MLFLIARASRIMVISQYSRDITCRVYGAPSTIIEVIEHGGPDRPFERQAAFKQTLGLDGRTVLMTFGLLSPGDAGRNKAMALFPERINGLYTMIGRHDGKTCSCCASDPLSDWNREGALPMEPRYLSEFIQIGNCGSPIRTSAGWLLLTHAAGAMRKYAPGCALLTWKIHQR